MVEITIHGEEFTMVGNIVRDLAEFWHRVDNDVEVADGFEKIKSELGLDYGEFPDVEVIERFCALVSKGLAGLSFDYAFYSLENDNWFITFAVEY